MLMKRDIAPVKGFADGRGVGGWVEKRGIKLILVLWETKQPNSDFNHSLIYL